MQKCCSAVVALHPTTEWFPAHCETGHTEISEKYESKYQMKALNMECFDILFIFTCKNCTKIITFLCYKILLFSYYICGNSD